MDGPVDAEQSGRLFKTGRAESVETHILKLLQSLTLFRGGRLEQ
jgi:hypothetical protein